MTGPRHCGDDSALRCCEVRRRLDLGKLNLDGAEVARWPHAIQAYLQGLHIARQCQPRPFGSRPRPDRPAGASTANIALLRALLGRPALPFLKGVPRVLPTLFCVKLAIGTLLVF